MKWLLALTLLIPATSNATLKVVVVDTGIDFTHKDLKGHECRTGHKDFTNESLNDINGHGTHVAGLIVRNAKNADYCIISVKFYSESQSSGEHVRNLSNALEYAVTLKPDIINLSGGGNEPSTKEMTLIADNPNITFIVAAGNENSDLQENPFYPAAYGLPNIIPVGAINREGSKLKVSNYGRLIKVWELGEAVLSTLPHDRYGRLTGTSQATAIHSGKVIYERFH